MKRYIRQIASVTTMAIFFIMALSCECIIWGDRDEDCFPSSSGTPEFKCEWYNPPKSVQHKIFIRVVDAKSKEPIENARINLYIYKKTIWQDPTNPDKCGFSDESDPEVFRNFEYLTNGYYSLKINTTYYSPLESRRVTLNVQAEGYNTSFFKHNFGLKATSEGKSETVELVEFVLFP